ncbi:MAG: hypothetical protein ACI8XM_000024 [Haloarculaceae archaeon]|jgi:hypothetical protein
MSDQPSTISTVPTDRSVTCAICGALADERETISLWADDYDPSPTNNRTLVAMLPDGQAHSDCFQRVADDPILVPEAALDTVMEFLRRDDHFLGHVNADDDLAAAIVALNLACDTNWPDQDWTTEWSR